MKNTGTLKLTTPTDREVVLTRVFDAPRHLVWEAMTKPELLKRWLFGPPGWSLAVCEMDLRVGGAYRYVWRGPDGIEMGMGGIHREIVCPERIVCTQLFDQDWTGGEALGTVVLTEQDGKTTLTNTIRYSSKEARDAVLKTPMEHGMAMGYDRLAELLAKGTVQGSPQSHLVYELVPMAHVADVEQSIRFYELLGFLVKDRVQHGGKTQWAWITSGKGHLMFAAAGEPVVPQQQAVLFYLYSQNIATLRSHLLTSGLSDGGKYCGGNNDARRVVFTASHPPYMPEGEMRVVDPDGYCLLVGQCELKS